MSAPDTNIHRQARQHKPALSGMSVAVAVAAVLFLGWLAWVFIAADAPQGAETQVQPGVGTVESSEGVTPIDPVATDGAVTATDPMAPAASE